MARVTRPLAVLLFLTVFTSQASAGGLFDYLAEKSTSSPVPYEENEFPEWARGARRFSIVSLGILPMASMVTVLVYDAVTGISSSPDDETQVDIINKISITVSISAVLGIADLIIHYTRRGN